MHQQAPQKVTKRNPDMISSKGLSPLPCGPAWGKKEKKEASMVPSNPNLQQSNCIAHASNSRFKSIAKKKNQKRILVFWIIYEK